SREGFPVDPYAKSSPPARHLGVSAPPRLNFAACDLSRAPEFERWTPCPAEGRVPARIVRTRRSWAPAARLRAVTSAERGPGFQLARRLRARPAAVRGPVLRPPWRRQRPLHMAGWRHSLLQRVRAPQRGTARKSPEGLPFFSRPRRADGDESERS